jgi:hypothetical protein
MAINMSVMFKAVSQAAARLRRRALERSPDVLINKCIGGNGIGKSRSGKSVFSAESEVGLGEQRFWALRCTRKNLNSFPKGVCM